MRKSGDAFQSQFAHAVTHQCARTLSREATSPRGWLQAIADFDLHRFRNVNQRENTNEFFLRLFFANPETKTRIIFVDPMRAPDAFGGLFARTQ